MQSKSVDFDQRDYGKHPLSEKELSDMIGSDPVEKYLNTRTALYREKNMKQKPPTKDDAIKLMVNDPNLLKRPVFIKGTIKLVGFDEEAVNLLIGVL